MSDAAAPAPAKAPAKKATKAKKPAKKPDHPTTAVMVNAAIKGLADRKGSSLAAIKKYIAANYKVDVARLAPFIRKYLKKAVEAGKLTQAKGSGATGSFKLNKAVKAEKPKKKPAAKKAKKPKAAKPKKAKTPKKKAAAKPKKAKTPKKAAKPKKAAAKPKKAKTPKKAAKKPAAKKAAKK